MSTFTSFNIDDYIVRALNKMGFEEATPIQQQTIPVALEGKDLIGQAQTGTGKTAAFGIPLIQKIDKESGDVQALILTPTRELAMQVAEELNRIGQFSGIRSLPIYGGQEIGKQIKSLKKRPQIIVGTPGRLMDHMRRRTIRLHAIQLAILDEADEMLNMGFLEDIETILSEVPEERQTLLFSATMPKSIQDLAMKFMNNPEMIRVKAKEVTMPKIEQHYMEVRPKEKFDVLCRLLDIHSPELAIIFARTKRRVDEVTEGLISRGYSAEGTHGDLTQSKRDRVLRQFREGNIDFLIATDVAARGLDISGVTHVYNFDLPQDPESYVHRIGRTGRAGNIGLATTFVTPREMDHLHLIERTTKRKIDRKPVPTFAAAIEGQQQVTVEKLLSTVSKGDYKSYNSIAKDLLDETDAAVLLAAALKLLTKEPESTPIQLTEEPLRSKRSSFSKGKGRSGGGRNSGGGRGRNSHHRSRPHQKRGGQGGQGRKRYSNAD
ncbi:DEAD/DEAH box helicase [Mechercharimyces sp. CAU 1602]|uniref:DEAD/DEAH box helicase n=1 Tax=Mechercharimyces sp. CAU 1602 TaxID=2973933 RepID=UPI002161E488|nr:DEAD/DEAH box helicase [Mechercharimyces sp. CAU 1602]MCS1351871.1 DEAD/DEAH box helicase [Mechercharimyces sp. CAU 1602]